MNSDSFDDYLNNYMDDNTASYKYKTDDYGTQEEEHRSLPIAVENTFHDHLRKQIGLLKLKDENQFKIAMQLIGSIDDDGYLRREPNAIIDDLLFSQNIVVTEKKFWNCCIKSNPLIRQVLEPERFRNVCCCKSGLKLKLQQVKFS